MEAVGNWTDLCSGMIRVDFAGAFRTHRSFSVINVPISPLQSFEPERFDLAQRSFFKTVLGETSVCSRGLGGGHRLLGLCVSPYV